jgi:hypothetical protein
MNAGLMEKVSIKNVAKVVAISFMIIGVLWCRKVSYNP